MLVEGKPKFAASARIEGERAVLALEGELDFGVEHEAQTALERIREARVVVIDLSELTFMDTSGVHLLLEARDHCRASGRMLHVVPGLRNVQRGLAALELESEFTFAVAP